jgi:hypothetical protein
MKRLAGIFLPVVILALFPACGTVESSAGAADLTKEVDRLQGLYKEAVRVPITPQIVGQIRKENKDYLLGEIRYFASVNIALMHSRAGESSMSLETRELPKVTRTARPREDPPQEAAPEAPPAVQEVPVLTFREGGSSLDQRRITSDDEGHLKGLNPEGDIFEIHYPDRGITLGFTLNREENWYDLEFAVDESTGEKTSLAMTGVRPHLMINYQAVFPFGETRIQMDKILPQPIPPESGPPQAPPEPLREAAADPVPPPQAPPEPPQEAAADPVPPPQTPPEPPWEVAADPVLPRLIEPSPPAESLAEGEDQPYPGAETAGPGGVYLEEAPPTAWGEDYLDEGESPDVEVVFLTEETRDSGGTGSGPGNCYTIQVGAFLERRNASAAFAALERAGFQPRYESDRDQLTRVVIPAVEGGDLARIREKIRALGLGEPWVRQ